MTPENQIEAQDRILSALRDGWAESTPANESKWKERINAVLDERLRLMALRDQLNPTTPQP